jgi:hypothetical protein
LLFYTSVPGHEHSASLKETVLHVYSEHTKSGERLDFVEWMVTELITNRRDVDSPLIFQPYIMALMLKNVTDFRGCQETEHWSYRAYNLKREVLEREPSPGQTL